MIDDEDHKFKIANIVRISEYKNIFAKVCFKLVWRKFVITELENVIGDIRGEEVVGMFYE